MQTRIIAKPVKVVIYNNSTSATTSTWTLAIPSNDLRQGWVIENMSANPIDIGIGDNTGSVTQILTLSAGEITEQTQTVITSSLFVKSGTASQTFLATELN